MSQRPFKADHALLSLLLLTASASRIEARPAEPRSVPVVSPARPDSRAVTLKSLANAVQTWKASGQPLVRPGAGVKAQRADFQSVPSITDASGRALVLRGLNMGNKQAPYIPDMTDADFATLESWGVNTVRFLILWAGIEPQEGVYNDAYLDSVEPFLDMAARHHVQVILDMHQDVYGEMFWQDGSAKWACPEELTKGKHPYRQWWLAYASPQVNNCFSWFWHNAGIQAHWIEAWRRAAERLGNHPAVIGFDLFNEPWPGYDLNPSFEPELLQALYEKVIPVLQAEAPEAWVFFEPWVLRDYFVPSFLTPMPFERIAYIPHFYSLQMELTGAYSGTGADVVNWVSHIQGEAADWNVPFIVGEYGGDSNGEGIGDLINYFNNAMDAANTGGMLWFFGKNDGGYSVLMSDGSEKSWMIEPLVRPYPRAVAGSLSSYEWAPDTRRFELYYTHDALVTAPTEVAVPSRLFPNGFDLSLSDTTHMQSHYDATSGILTLTDSGATGARSVVVSGL